MRIKSNLFNFQGFLALLILLAVGTNMRAQNQAKIGDTEYATLADAVAAVTSGQTITLLADVDYGEFSSGTALTIPADKNFILDLGGYTIQGKATNAGTSQLIQNYAANLEIRNGTITYSSTEPDPSWGYGTSTIRNCGTLTLTSGKIINTTVNGASYAIDNITNESATDAVLNVNGGEITCEKGDQAVRILGNSSGKISGGDRTVKSVLNMTGGTITAGGIWGDFLGPGDFYYEINISGGSVTGMLDFMPNGSNAQVNITGGTFNTSKLRLRNPRDGRTTPDTPYINIKGGTWTIDVLDNQNSVQSVSITGGTFMKDPTAVTNVDGKTTKDLSIFLAEGYSFAERSGSGGNYWIVGSKEVAMEQSNTVTITEEEGNTDVSSDETAKAAVAETLNNTAVTGKIGTNVDEGTQTARTEAAKTADANSINSQIKITLTTATTVSKTIASTATTVVNSMIFDVKPTVTYTTTTSEGTTTNTVTVTHTDVPVTFRLPVDKNVINLNDVKSVGVKHRATSAETWDDLGLYPILKDESYNCFVEITASDFSEYEIKNTSTEITYELYNGSITPASSSIENFNTVKTTNPNAILVMTANSTETNIIKKSGTEDSYTYTADNIVLTDGYDYYFPNEFTANSISYTRNLNATASDAARKDYKWIAVCLPFPYTHSTASGTAAKMKTEGTGTAKGNYIKLEAYENGTVIPAGTPFLFASTSSSHTFSASNVTVTSSATPGTSSQTIDKVGTVILHGVYQTTGMQSNKGWYLTANNTISWNPTGTEIKLKAFRFYMTIEQNGSSYYPGFSSGVKAFMFSFDDDDFMSIDDTETETAERTQTIYNLSGQKLDALQKGINIVNGKKIYVK